MVTTRSVSNPNREKVRYTDSGVSRPKISQVPSNGALGARTRPSASAPEAASGESISTPAPAQPSAPVDDAAAPAQLAADLDQGAAAPEQPAAANPEGGATAPAPLAQASEPVPAATPAKKKAATKRSGSTAATPKSTSKAKTPASATPKTAAKRKASTATATPKSKKAKTSKAASQPLAAATPAEAATTEPTNRRGPRLKLTFNRLKADYRDLCGSQEANVEGASGSNQTTTASKKPQSKPKTSKRKSSTSAPGSARKRVRTTAAEPSGENQFAPTLAPEANLAPSAPGTAAGSAEQAIEPAATLVPETNLTIPPGSEILAGPAEQASQYGANQPAATLVHETNMMPSASEAAIGEKEPTPEELEGAQALMGLKNAKDSSTPKAPHKRSGIHRASRNASIKYLLNRDYETTDGEEESVIEADAVPPVPNALSNDTTPAAANPGQAPPRHVQWAPGSYFTDVQTPAARRKSEGDVGNHFSHAPLPNQGTEIGPPTGESSSQGLFNPAFTFGAAAPHQDTQRPSTAIGIVTDPNFGSVSHFNGVSPLHGAPTEDRPAGDSNNQTWAN
ncbi:hypothetical protein AAP_02537 [Ascosphaera apis ARSEF 7405]|uniref:Uncharacterized protein n=1 Tax=Ascosphaera apis ARSEF 7405 TaxID=392613 RepID=A0A167ZTE9_9EURO|nr:hypothetical protein AAP_02537 [Ascosphaera apis ARSEF 7405]